MISCRTSALVTCHLMHKIFLPPIDLVLGAHWCVQRIALVFAVVILNGTRMLQDHERTSLSSFSPCDL